MLLLIPHPLAWKKCATETETTVLAGWCYAMGMGERQQISLEVPGSIKWLDSSQWLRV